MDCRFFVREAQVARFDEGVLPSALSIFHDDSSFRSGQFIMVYLHPVLLLLGEYRHYCIYYLFDGW